MPNVLKRQTRNVFSIAYSTYSTGKLEMLYLLLTNILTDNKSIHLVLTNISPLSFDSKMRPSKNVELLCRFNSSATHSTTAVQHIQEDYPCYRKCVELSEAYTQDNILENRSKSTSSCNVAETMVSSNYKPHS